MSVAGDSIGTWDLSQRRFSLFTVDRGFTRILPTPARDSGQSDRGDARQLFSNLPFVAFARGRIAFGSGERFEVMLADSLLRVTDVLRWNVADERLTEAEVARRRDTLRANMPPGAPADRIERALNDIVAVELLPTVRPAISRALWDDAGRLWLGRFEAPVRGLAEASEWFVLGPDLTPQGRVRLPPNARLEAVRGDDLRLALRDSLDVQTVQVWSLKR